MGNYETRPIVKDTRFQDRAFAPPNHGESMKIIKKAVYSSKPVSGDNILGADFTHERLGG